MGRDYLARSNGRDDPLTVKW